MTARPLSTFASEGWARPSGARTAHYYRPGGPLGLTSVCGSWQSSDGLRPWLTTVPGRTPNGTPFIACQRCDHRVREQLNRRTGEWFDDDTPADTAQAVS